RPFVSALEVLLHVEHGLLIQPLLFSGPERGLAPAHRPPAEAPRRSRRVVEGAGGAAERAEGLADLPAVEEHLGNGRAVAVLAADRQPEVAVADGGGGDGDGLLAVGRLAGQRGRGEGAGRAGDEAQGTRAALGLD